jgi:hypothetical protein
MPLYLATIVGRDYDAMADLVCEHGIGVLRHTVRQPDDGCGYRVDALVDSQQIRTLEAAGYRVEGRENVEGAGRARPAERVVGR